MGNSGRTGRKEAHPEVWGAATAQRVTRNNPEGLPEFGLLELLKQRLRMEQQEGGVVNQRHHQLDPQIGKEARSGAQLPVHFALGAIYVGLARNCLDC